MCEIAIKLINYLHNQYPTLCYRIHILVIPVVLKIIKKVSNFCRVIASKFTPIINIFPFSSLLQ